MASAVSKVPPEFELTIWVKPHRGWGHLVHLDTDSILVKDFGLRIYRQSLEVTRDRRPKFAFKQPHESRLVDPAWVLDIGSRLDQISYSLAEHSYGPTLDGPNYGFELKRGYQEVMINWYGQFSDQAPDLCELWSLIDGAFEEAQSPLLGGRL